MPMSITNAVSASGLLWPQPQPHLSSPVAPGPAPTAADHRSSCAPSRVFLPGTLDIYLKWTIMLITLTRPVAAVDSSSGQSTPPTFDLDCQLTLASAMLGLLGLQLWLWSFVMLRKQIKARAQDGPVSDGPLGQDVDMTGDASGRGFGSRRGAGFGAGPRGRGGGPGRHMTRGMRGGVVGILDSDDD